MYLSVLCQHCCYTLIRTIMNAAHYSLPASLYIMSMQLADSSVLKEKVAHCHLRVLRLTADKAQLPSILNGVKDNCSIEDLAVAGEFISTACL